ncbi:hypothetical protein DFH29DRAFT_433931 [Suillus ampliporus]|nr:hypothetical protein DFH29DRAFT_433931 [Suillus ampliporus]
MSSPKVWFITGTSSGFVRCMTEYALSQGDSVVATLRKPEILSDFIARYPADKLLVLKVDVKNQEEIDEAFARTREVFGRLDVVFNNAGYALFTEVEGTPVDTAREMFETNFWGSKNVSRSAVQFFREVDEPGKGGILLQVSSIAGFHAFPGLTYYAATKHGRNTSRRCVCSTNPSLMSIRLSDLTYAAWPSAPSWAATSSWLSASSWAAASSWLSASSAFSRLSTSSRLSAPSAV